MFYHYSQNNSGGSFDFDGERGITHHVIIEAQNAEQANDLAEEIGLYFNGCDYGEDFSCCGDRWFEAYGEGDEEPMIYGEPATSGWKPRWHKWMGENPEAYIHFADGRIEAIQGD